MSKDIWHNADETPKAERYFIEHYKVVVGDKVYWKYGLFKGVSNYDYPFDQDTARWCYLDDLLALETENKDLSDKIGKLETELDRTRKALDVANEKLRHCVNITVEELDELKGNLLIAWNALMHFSKDPIANNALKKITALEQKE